MKLSESLITTPAASYPRLGYYDFIACAELAAYDVGSSSLNYDTHRAMAWAMADYAELYCPRWERRECFDFDETPPQYRHRRILCDLLPHFIWNDVGHITAPHRALDIEPHIKPITDRDDVDWDKVERSMELFVHHLELMEKIRKNETDGHKNN